MAQEEHTGRKLAIGALIAGVAGYITGILTAPKSGKETRKDIANKAGDLKSEAGQQLQKANDELSHTIDSAKDKTQALGAKAREEYNEALLRAKDARSKAGAVLKAVRAGKSDEPELNKAIGQVKQAGKNLGKYLRS